MKMGWPASHAESTLPSAQTLPPFPRDSGELWESGAHDEGCRIVQRWHRGSLEGPGTCRHDDGAY